MPIFGRMYLFNTYQQTTAPPSNNKSFIVNLRFFNYKIHEENNIINAIRSLRRDMTQFFEKSGVYGLKIVNMQSTIRFDRGQ